MADVAISRLAAYVHLLQRTDEALARRVAELEKLRSSSLAVSSTLDLDAVLSRILHDRSFIDDATRMLRAVRYEQRFSFRLDQSTEALLHRELPMLGTISGDRIRHELELILKEHRPEDALERAQALGLLARVHPALKVDAWLREEYRMARSASPPSPTLYLALLTYRLGVDETEDFIARLRIPRRAAAVMRGACRLPRSSR